MSRRMNEKIVVISNYQNTRGYLSVAGFEVVTNDQRIKLYIEDNQDCCELWGYFWCNDNPQDFVGATLWELSLTDTALNTQMIENNGADYLDAGEIMFVNFNTSKGVLQFVAYNSHNGYYGHTATVESKQLKHSEYL